MFHELQHSVCEQHQASVGLLSVGEASVRAQQVLSGLHDIGALQSVSVPLTLYAVYAVSLQDQPHWDEGSHGQVLWRPGAGAVEWDPEEHRSTQTQGEASIQSVLQTQRVQDAPPFC